MLTDAIQQTAFMLCHPGRPSPQRVRFGPDLTGNSFVMADTHCFAKHRLRLAQKGHASVAYYVSAVSQSDLSTITPLVPLQKEYVLNSDGSSWLLDFAGLSQPPPTCREFSIAGEWALIGQLSGGSKVAPVLHFACTAPARCVRSSGPALGQATLEAVHFANGQSVRS